MNLLTHVYVSRKLRVDGAPEAMSVSIGLASQHTAHPQVMMESKGPVVGVRQGNMDTM